MLWRNVRQRVRRDKNFTHRDHKDTKTDLVWRAFDLSSFRSFATFAISVWIVCHDRNFTHRDHKGHKDPFGLRAFDPSSFRSFATFAISVWIVCHDRNFTHRDHKGHEDPFGLGAFNPRHSVPLRPLRSLCGSSVMTGILHTEITKDTKTDLVGGLRSLVIPFLCDLCVDRLSGSEFYTPRSQRTQRWGPFDLEYQDSGRRNSNRRVTGQSQRRP
jgi:hypothetical protein